MLTILHGDDTEQSRTELTRLRTAATTKEVRHLDGKSLDPNTLTQALQSQSMFGGDVLVIIERLCTSLGRKTKSIGEFAKFLSQERDVDIILWEDKELSPTTLKAFGPKATIRIYKTPVVLFQFLDTLKPHTGTVLLSLLEHYLSTGAVEVIFSMLVRRVRLLIMVKDNVLPGSMQPWQTARLTNQSKFFTIQELLSMEKKLLAIEYSIKSGRSPLTLKTHLEQFLIDL